MIIKARFADERGANVKQSRKEIIFLNIKKRHYNRKNINIFYQLDKPYSFSSSDILCLPSNHLIPIDTIRCYLDYRYISYRYLFDTHSTRKYVVDNRQLVCKKEKKKEIKKALSNFFETTSSGPFLLGWKRREEKRGENFCWPARSWLERSVKAATPFSTYRVLSSLTKCPVCRAAMVLDLLPLHRQIRTCHGFIRSLVNDGGNTGGGSRQRRTVGDKSRFPTSAATQILRVYVCVCIDIVGYWCLFRKIEMPNESHRGEARCDAKLTRRRLGALACLLAGEYYLLYRIVA